MVLWKWKHYGRDKGLKWYFLIMRCDWKAVTVEPVQKAANRKIWTILVLQDQKGQLQRSQTTLSRRRSSALQSDLFSIASPIRLADIFNLHKIGQYIIKATIVSVWRTRNGILTHAVSVGQNSILTLKAGCGCAKMWHVPTSIHQSK